MQNTLVTLLLFFCCSLVYSQFGPQQIITTDALVAEAVFAADVDGDGDMDALSASRGDDTIAWYENLDGQGNFGPKIIITPFLQETTSLFATDIDGDGDIDVVANSRGSDLVVWYENLDGLGTFSLTHGIATNIDGALSVYAGDMDGDGDMDVLSASFLDHTIAWYENLDGLGNFGPKQVINNNALSAKSVLAADFDGDGDLDVLSASGGDGNLTWYENTNGMGSFGSPQIIMTLFGDGINACYATDIDGDGDIDALSISPAGNKIAWYENLDGQGNFGPQQVVTVEADTVLSVYSADIDMDGDTDLFSASAADNKIAWYENLDGLGNFGPQQIISLEADSARSVFSADINGDGYMDVLSASVQDDKIAWYENLLPLTINEYTLSYGIIYPNPVKEELYLELKDPGGVNAIFLYDVLGREVLKIEGYTKAINVDGLKKGVYFLHLETDQGRHTQKIIKE